MHNRERKIDFVSPLGTMMAMFIKEKQACGYSYLSESLAISCLDRFLCQIGLKKVELPRQVVESWISKRPHESSRTHQTRTSILRQLALYLSKHGIDVYIPDIRMTSINRLGFVPYIFSHDEMGRILETIDHLPKKPNISFRHLIMPEVFRLLYYCGMRINEVLRLRVADVDLPSGVLTVRKGKFNKDRLVPLPPSLTVRLRSYALAMGERDAKAAFFPAPDGGNYSRGAVYDLFRQTLLQCGIPHRGRGKGPRLHDFRHSFAVRRLESWYRQGADLGNKLPILAVYMGHRSLAGTQRYLRLTPEIFPDITERMERTVGHIIPGRVEK